MAMKSNSDSVPVVPAIGQVSRRDVLRYGVGAAVASTMMPAMSLASGAGMRRSIVVETVAGRLRGVVANGGAAFKGIPYGQSTAGRNRFMPPQAVKPWAGIRDATRLGHPCLQTNPDFPDWSDPVGGSEDCLVLNVWAPEHAHAESKLPVMFWVHGGGYAFGSGGAPLYDGGILATTGNVVVVGINHRLHAFGFSDLSEFGGDDFAASGNAGQLDIIAALKWVRDNIEVFGGDPANVTPFGQSGGGAKIGTLMTMPAATGLFHKAIIQSGSVLRCRSRTEAATTSRRMFEILGISTPDVGKLQALPAAVLNKCANQIISEATGVGNPVLIYAPVVDGHWLPTELWSGRAPAGAGSIPMLLGTTLHETVIYVNDKDRREITGDPELADAIARATTVNSPDPERVAAILPAYRESFHARSSTEIVVRVSTDIGFWKGAVHQAELQCGTGAPVYMYRCDWRTPCFGGMWAPHAIELPFVMGHRHYRAAWDGRDTDAARAAADPRGLRYVLGDRMLSAWVSFARSSNPSTPGLAWPRYDIGTRATMIFDGESGVSNDPSAEARVLVNRL